MEKYRDEKIKADSIDVTGDSSDTYTLGKMKVRVRYSFVTRKGVRVFRTVEGQVYIEDAPRIKEHANKVLDAQINRLQRHREPV